jgi:hypothetical protein
LADDIMDQIAMLGANEELSRLVKVSAGHPKLHSFFTVSVPAAAGVSFALYSSV